jgi:hypothetical protein
VVLSEKSFLGPREIENMRVVPELVFVNCCHLAARSSAQLVRKYDRARFAATVAEKLISIGVRCVIAAGWAVDDTTANAFATTFYDAILRGRRFLDAVADAREVAQAAGGNTWAAYQCYGDPDWIFRRQGADAQAVARPSTEFAGIASAIGLENALETLEVESKYQGRTGEAQRVRLAISRGPVRGPLGRRRQRRDRVRGGVGRVGGATSRHSMVRASGRRAGRHRPDLCHRAARELARARGVGRRRARADRCAHHRWEERQCRAFESATRGPRQGGQRRAAGNRRGDRARQKLVALCPSFERSSLLASAYKRRAMVRGAAGERADDDIGKMKACYAEAEDAATKAGLRSAFYPMLNLLAADLLLRKRGKSPLAPRRVKEVRAVLEHAMRDDPEFWAAAGEIELTIYEALASAEGLRGKLKQIEGRYRDLNARVKAKSMWRSVYDQASFVLSRCALPGAAAERRAAEELLKLLKSFG